MFNWFKSKQKAHRHSALSVNVSAKQSTVVGTVDATTSTPPNQFISDEPISGSVQDRFNRAPFAARIADTIAHRPDSSSLEHPSLDLVHQ